MEKPYISVFFPTFNEEDNIEMAVAAAKKALEQIGKSYEIIIVDDASTDRTAFIADMLAENDEHVLVFHHLKNTKLGGALRTGFYRARGDVIFYTDADNPIDMSDLGKNLPLIKEFDFITGFRLNRDETFLRAVYSRVYNFIIRFLFGLRVRDVNFSFKLVRRQIIDTVSLHSRGSFIDAELLLEARRRKYRITEVGIHYHPRTRGKSTLARPSVILVILKELCAYIGRLITHKQDRPMAVLMPPLKQM